jgi:hypothetical protein
VSKFLPPSSFVTLNLFQGPSGNRREWRLKSETLRQDMHKHGYAAVQTSQAAKWMLKQVQHDDMCKATIC